MKIGKYNIYQLNTGTFALDGGAMFGIIPKPLWEKTNPSDDKNRVLLAANNLLLIGNNKKILIDTGMGDKWDQKARSIYNINQQQSSLEISLTQHSVKADEITDVILTHLHFDHAGGATRFVDGKLCPAFPNAKYFVQKKNYEWAVNPTERDKGSYLPDNFMPLYNEGVLNLVNEDFRFDDYISFIVINGHTFGQQMVRISDSSRTLLFGGDLVPFSSHIHLPYIMGYDLQPLITLEEKKRIFGMAADQEWKIFFEHDPYSDCAIIERTDKGYKIKNKIELLND